MTALNYCNDNESTIIDSVLNFGQELNYENFSEAAWENYATNAEESPEFDGEYEFDEEEFKAAAARYYEQTLKYK